MVLFHFYMRLMPTHYSPKKNWFIEAVEAGKSIQAASDHYGIPFSTARDIWHKFQESGSTHAQPCSGRPVKITNWMCWTIIHKAKANQKKHLDQVGRMVDPPISASSVQNILNAVGLHQRWGQKVVYLTKEHKIRWKEWVKEHKKWSDEDWERVIWSNKCYVYISDNQGTVWVTRAVGNEYNEGCTIPTFKQSPLRVMIWSCIMKGSQGPLVVLDYPGGKGGGMTAQRYQVQVLDKVLFNYYWRMAESRGQVVFQQDRAWCHTAKLSIEWLSRNEIEIFPHPASSPDLSLIEPLWHHLKILIRARPHIPSRLEELKTAIWECWEMITDDDINAHVKHMEDRVKAVLKADGGHMKY